MISSQMQNRARKHVFAMIGNDVQTADDSMNLRGPENKWPPLQKFHVLFNSIPFGPKSGRPIQKPTWLQTATSWM